MSIPLTGTGGLFTRLGRIGAALRAVNLFRGTGALLVNSVVGAAGTVTVTTFLNHGFSTGDTVTIAGCNTAGFNGSFTITVTGLTTFTYSNATTGTDTSKSITATKTLGAGFFSVGPYIDNIYAQFASADQDLIDSLYSNRNSYRSVHSALTTYLQTLAKSVVTRMANDSSPLSSQTYSVALQALISQMQSTGNSVKKPNITTSVTPGASNNGNAVVVASAIGGNGLQLDYCIAEQIVLTVTSDSQSGAALWFETINAVGAVAESDPLNWDWPLGSGVNVSFSAVDSSVDASSGQLLTNGDFEAFTVSNVPDHWTVVTGTPGTTVFESSSANAYRDSGALQITGNGSELTSLTQQFNSASGTTSTLSPLTVYAVNFFLKVSAVPSAGVLEVALVDGSGNIINNAQGVPNKVTVNLTGASTSYAAYNGFFQTPAVLPSTINLRVRLSTALDNGKSVFVDDICMTSPNQLYPGGLYVTAFSGNSKLIVNDTYLLNVISDYSSQWQLMLDRLFNMKALGLAVPSSSSPTIPDSLIS